MQKMVRMGGKWRALSHAATQRKASPLFFAAKDRSTSRPTERRIEEAPGAYTPIVPVIQSQVQAREGAGTNCGAHGVFVDIQGMK
jgi:hypothetical protein